jgi:hypothetical protein
MAGTAALSSNFIITYIPATNAGAETSLIALQPRGFKVIGVAAMNGNAATRFVEVERVRPGAANAVITDNAPEAAATSMTFIPMKASVNREFISGDSIQVVTEASGPGQVESVLIFCTAASGGTALTAVE